jgi:hypothetical protein
VKKESLKNKIMKKIGVLLMMALSLSLFGESKACTSALVSASKSSEGVPLLWKHRDSPDWDCHVEHIEGGKYAYTALVSKNKRYTYCGINEEGFAILNTVSENLTKSPTISQGPGAIFNMARALRECATVEEFEKWLTLSNGKRPYVTNFAVGDASGALAYFEVWGESFKRYDVSERKEGFDIRSNFSYAGNMENPGPSVPRYEIAKRQMEKKSSHSPYDFYHYSRNFILRDGAKALDADGVFVCNDITIPRYMSVASAVMVCDKDNPRMLAMVGHPVVGVPVPVYVKAKTAIPECVGGRSALDLSEAFRAKAYKKVAELKYEVNEPLVNALLKFGTQYKMPKKMPCNIEKFNSKVDRFFENHAKKVRKVLD